MQGLKAGPPEPAFTMDAGPLLLLHALHFVFARVVPGRADGLPHPWHQRLRARPHRRP